MSAFLVVVSFTMFLLINAVKQPDYMPRCNRDQPKLSECLIKAAEEIKPYLVKGIPELGLPEIENLKIPTITLQQGNHAVNGKAVLKDINLNGLAGYNCTRFDFDVPNLKFYMNIIVKNLKVDGIYTLTGNILVVPIEGHGPLTVNVSQIEVVVYQEVRIVKRKGLEYLRNVNLTLDVKIGDAKVHLDGLFGGNQELAQATNGIINENVQMIFMEIKPVVQKVVVDIAETLLVEKLQNQIPYAQLFPVTKNKLNKRQTN